MAISLNGIALNPSLMWLDEFNYDTVTQKLIYTLDAGYRVYSMHAPNNRPITLVANEESGWFTREMVVAIKAIESVPKAEYPLIIRDQTFNVVFRHDDPPAFEVVPLIPRGGSLPGDFFRGVLKLFHKV
jgi:hypothetical protein